METKKNVYEMVTERIIAKMQEGIIPWQRPWGNLRGKDVDIDTMAVSWSSKTAYSILNQFLLGEPGEYLTFKQVVDNGGKVLKGAKARMVVFFTFVEKTEKDEKTGEDKLVRWPILKYYHVFHIKDTEGIKGHDYNKGEKIEAKPVDERAEEIIAGYLSREAGLKFENNHASDKAYYSPAFDKVVVPMIGQYKNPNEYYSTTFHELTHSTMKASRCDREADNKNAAFGNADYSREELVAEIGSAMLCNSCGIECEKTFKNSVAYIQSWIKALKNDPRMIVWASSRAEKAAKYILGVEA